MLSKLKDDILRLLKEDEEFRYAIVGLLGLQRLEDAVARLADSHLELKSIVARLADIQARQEERLIRVEERQEEHDRKFNAILEELSVQRAKLEEHDRKFNEIIEEIRMIRLDITELRGDMKDVRTEMKKVTDKYGLTLEDLAITKLPIRLQEEGIVVNRRDIRTRYPVIIKGKEIEVDIYVEGKSNGKIVKVIGEVRARIDKRDVNRFYDRFKDYDALRCMLGHTIRPEAEDIAKELDVKLYSIIG